jgi:hypothetical protein
VTVALSPPPAPPPRRRAPRLPRWLGIVFPLVVLTALGMTYTAAVNRTLHPAAVQVGGAVALGLVAGALTRRSAASRPLATQWWIAEAAATLGLLLAGLLTGGRSGIAAPLVGGSTARLAELAWLALAGLGAWLALRYRRPRPVRPPRRTLRQRVHSAQESWQIRLQRLSPARIWRRQRLGRRQTRPRLTTASVAASPQATRRRASVGSARPSSKGKAAKSVRPSTARPPGRASRRFARRGIRFTGSEEARCPYCLEPVQPHDPRGSKVCPVCHTRHHADCWAVTGVCQMPHLYDDASAGQQGANR